MRYAFFTTLRVLFTAAGVVCGLPTMAMVSLFWLAGKCDEWSGELVPLTVAEPECVLIPMAWEQIVNGDGGVVRVTH